MGEVAGRRAQLGTVTSRNVAAMYPMIRLVGRYTACEIRAGKIGRPVLLPGNRSVVLGAICISWLNREIPGNRGELAAGLSVISWSLAAGNSTTVSQSHVLVVMLVGWRKALRAQPLKPAALASASPRGSLSLLTRNQKSKLLLSTRSLVRLALKVNFLQSSVENTT